MTNNNIMLPLKLSILLASGKTKRYFYLLTKE
jgi:hypothetical protein